MASKSELTRERILDAAARVLSRSGYAGMRLTDVAREAGLHTGALYYYFPSKDLLVEEVMYVGANTVRLHVESVVADLPSEATAVDRIMAAIDAHLRCVLQISDYTRASIRNASHVPQELRKRPAAEERIYSRTWRDFFDRGVEEGSVRADLDIQTYRMLLLGSLNWVLEWWRPSSRGLDDVIAVAQDAVRRVIEP